MKNKTYLLLGSNLGNRTQVLKAAIKVIANQLGDLISTSSVYETSAWGLEDQPSFLNQVIQIETSLTSGQLIETIFLIEKEMGRVRLIKWGERLIDIDILYFNNEIIDTPALKMPHPEIQNRRFALIPLVEIAPEFLHPLLRKTQMQLLEECQDNLEVKLIV